MRAARWIDGAAATTSVVAHLVAACALWSNAPDAGPTPRSYAEVEVVERPAPAKPPPAPPPEPKPKPVPVPFAETLPTAPPPKVVQGLSAGSFAAGSGAGPTVRAGSSLTTAAPTPGGDDPVETYAAVALRPRCKAPVLDVPDSVVKGHVEGRVQIVFDVSPSGRVERVRVVSGLTADADAACVAAWSAVTCKPGSTDGTPVSVTDMPYSCRFEAIE